MLEHVLVSSTILNANCCCHRFFSTVTKLRFVAFVAQVKLSPVEGYGMASTQLTRNLSTPVNETTTKYNSDFCHPYTNSVLETVETTLPYTMNAFLNVLLAIVAIFANVLVFSAVRHSTSIRLPSKLLLCSLVLTDVGVGFVVQPQLATFLITKMRDSLPISCFFRKSFASTGAMLTCVSLLTMAAISLDRYIALFFHLNYHEIVTTRRVCVVVAIIWSFAAFFASIWFWSIELSTYLNLFGISVCLVVTSVAYIKIYRKLHLQHGHQVQNQAQVQARQQPRNTLDLAKYRRSASSMLWIYGLSILCYLPYFSVGFVVGFFKHNAFIECIFEFSMTLMYLNSCLNPFVYCFRLPDIRAKVRQTLRKMCGLSPQQ